MGRAVAFAISRTRKLIAANAVPTGAFHYVPVAARRSHVARAMDARGRSISSRPMPERGMGQARSRSDSDGSCAA